MSFMELANNRQSERSFTSQEVSRKDLLKCLQAAQLAPSACNSQPWKFIVLDNPQIVKQAAAAVADNPMGENSGQGTIEPLGPVRFGQRHRAFLFTGRRAGLGHLHHGGVQ